MRFDDLSKPVSDDKPAGPDLDEEMDSNYMNYTLVAPDRLPTGFLVQVPGSDTRKPFDRSTIELSKELDSIAGFLEQTRDIRLLTLDARFNAVSGNIIGFTEATQGLAIVVSTFWDELHPKPADGDMIVRQNTVESIDDLGQIVLHLQNATIAGGSRTRAVSLRNYLVANGKAEAREDEERISISDIASTMMNEANSARVTEVHAAIEASKAALETVRSTFLEKAGAEFSPSFPRLTELYQQMREMIGAYRTDLVPPSVAVEGTEEYASDGTSTLPAGSVKSHADATAALVAAENYFLRMEPSSPALILLHQARMLVGRPLTFALEALMPEPSTRAALRFDSGFKFDIDLSRMKLVTDDALANGIPEEPSDWPGQEAAAADTSSGWGSSEESSSESSDSNWGYSSETSEESSDSTASSDGSEEAASSDGGDTSTETAATNDGWGETSEASSEAATTDDGWGISEESPAAEPEPEPEPAPLDTTPPNTVDLSGPATFVARTRMQAAELMQATELFYRTAEPSSPIPILLGKARTYVSKDFATILSELIPREPEAASGQ